MSDLALAAVHHLLTFSLLGVLVAEWMLLRPSMTVHQAGYLAVLDRSYGAAAAAILGIGVLRVAFAGKGWFYYSHNLFFWSKMATFLAVGLLSIPPTIQYARWKQSSEINEPQVLRVRRWLAAQLSLFPLIPLFAAAMARGFGSF